MNTDEVKSCRCHLLEVMAEHDEFPIRYCDRTQTFQLVYLSGSGRMRLSYCFECGGKLPDAIEPTRSQPDPREQVEAETIMSQAKSLEEIAAVLGSPDETFPWTNVPIGDIFEDLADRFPDQYAHARKWKQCLRYSKRWPSLLLDIYEYEDGTIEHTIWEQNP